MIIIIASMNSSVNNTLTMTIHTRSVYTLFVESIRYLDLVVTLEPIFASSLRFGSHMYRVYG